MTDDRTRSDGDPRFFFIHVMKTGGTSLVTDLQRTFPDGEVFPHRTLDKSDPADVEPYTNIADLIGISDARRDAIRVYAGHFPYMVSEMMGIDFLTLTLLRDPVERTISVLKQFKRLTPRLQDNTLEEIYDDEFTFRHFVHNHQTKVFSLTEADKPRAILRAIDVDEHRLASAKANLETVDVIGLTERYPDFIEELRSRFGWWPEGLDNPVRTNVSSESWAIDEALRRRIALDNAIDVEFYDFARRLVEARAGDRS